MTAGADRPSDGRSSADPIGTALAAIGAGATTGAVVVTAGVLLLRVLQAGRPEDLSQDVGFVVLFASMFLGIAGAATTGWLRARIADRWRRGVVGGISVFGAVLLALIATPLDVFVGVPGIAGYVVLLSGAAVYLHGAARRAGAG